MKSKYTLILLCVSCSLGYAQKPTRLESFLEKVDSYYLRHTNAWSMPTYEPQTPEEMPLINGELFMLDEKTGLEYYPSANKMYQPELNIGLDVRSGTVFDFKTGAKYPLEDLKEKKNRKHQL